MPKSAHPATRRPGSLLLIASLLAVLCAASPAAAQALIKVSDTVNFRLGLLLQPQADFQEVVTATSDTYQQNLLVRRARFILGGQVAKDVFFYFDTENSSLGKSTQAVGGTTGTKALGSGFTLLDAVGEWRIAKGFNIQAGEILVPVNRWILTSSSATFPLDQSSYNLVSSAALQNNAGRDTGAMVRGYFFCDRLEYRSLVLTGYRAPGVQNSLRFTERLQWNFFDTEVYNMPSYTGVNYGRRKILALGAAYDTQGSYRLGSADLFMDLPIDAGSFISTIAYQYINGGTLLTSLPEESTFSVELGVFLKDLKIAPLVRFEQKTFTQAVNESKNEGRYVVGLNYYPIPKAENNLNFKVWYQRVTPKVGFATNEITVQMQIAYF
jgi:hypothetical protein